MVDIRITYFEIFYMDFIQNGKKNLSAEYNIDWIKKNLFCCGQ